MSLGYSDVVSTTALFISILGTFLSGYFSYRFAIKGEKRKEFNAAADKITLALMQQRNLALSGKNHRQPLSESDLYALLIVTDESKRQTLQDAISEYRQSIEVYGSWKGGIYIPSSPEILVSSIDKLLKCTARQ